MTDKRILWLWARTGDPVPMDSIKEAKVALDLPFMVVPRGLDRVVDERVLAIGSEPTWLVDYFLIGATAGIKEWKNALRWVLGQESDWEATSVEDTMTSVFGAGTREISYAELASEQKLDDYIHRRV